jgi:hypothetical protein
MIRALLGLGKSLPPIFTGEFDAHVRPRYVQHLNEPRPKPLLPCLYLILPFCGSFDYSTRHRE